MKICIFGAGAVGSMLGGELARAGRDVTLITRGPHLAAMRKNGLRLIFNGVDRVTHPVCTGDPAEAGPQDAVIFVVKAHQLAAAAEAAQPLLTPDTVIVAAQNGIPWWYFHRHGGPLEGRHLNASDPGGRIWELLGPERVIGGVINGACDWIEPGIISHRQRERSLTLGEPGGGESARCRAVAAVFAGSDVSAPIADDIRHATWHKLLSNISLSMLCVLTRSHLGLVSSDPGCRAVSARLLKEAEAVAGSLGLDISAAVAERLNAGAHETTHKPSTLQDLEAGRKMEIDAIIGAVAEIARLTGTSTPMIDSIYALLRRLASSLGCYPDNPAFVVEAAA